MNSKIKQTNNSIITIIANINGITAKDELITLNAIYNIFQNNPWSITKQSKIEIGASIIQIDNQRVAVKIETISVILHRLIKSNNLIKIDGLVKLHSIYNDSNKVEQIVLRFPLNK